MVHSIAEIMPCFILQMNVQQCQDGLYTDSWKRCLCLKLKDVQTYNTDVPQVVGNPVGTVSTITVCWEQKSLGSKDFTY